MWSGYIASCFCLQEMEISKIARLHVFMADPNHVSCDRGITKTAKKGPCRKDLKEELQYKSIIPIHCLTAG